MRMSNPHLAVDGLAGEGVVEEEGVVAEVGVAGLAMTVEGGKGNTFFLGPYSRYVGRKKPSI